MALTVCLVKLYLASGPLVPRETQAGEPGHLVEAGPRVVTGTLLALVHIQLAPVPLPAIHTPALVPVLKVQAGRVVPAGLGLTFIDIYLTINSSESRDTVTEITIGHVMTHSMLRTWR